MFNLHSSRAVQVAASPSVPRRSPYQQRPGRKAKFGGALGSKNPQPAFRSEASASWMILTACATMCHQLTMQKTMPSHTPQKSNSKLGIRPTGYQLSLTPGRSNHIPSPVHARDVHICAKPMPQHCSNYSCLCLPASSADMKLSRMRSFRMVSSFWPVLRQFLFWHESTASDEKAAGSHWVWDTREYILSRQRNRIDDSTGPWWPMGNVFGSSPHDVLVDLQDLLGFYLGIFMQARKHASTWVKSLSHCGAFGPRFFTAGHCWDFSHPSPFFLSVADIPHYPMISHLFGWLDIPQKGAKTWPRGTQKKKSVGTLMSSAWPCAPPMAWWIMVSVRRFSSQQKWYTADENGSKYMILILPK